MKCMQTILRQLVRLAAAAAAAAPAAALAQAGATWPTPGGDVQGTRYSALNQITSTNVGTMVEEFSYPTGVKASHEGGPLVVGNVMYVVTPWPNKLIALDLTHPGTALWTFNPKASGAARGVACCDLVNRGAVYANNTIVYNVLDGHTVAVNATTGKQIWKVNLANPTLGETLTGAPLIVANKVIVGVAGAELGVRGWVQALDLSTGKTVWKAYGTGPDKDVLIDGSFQPYYAKDQGVNLGTTTWPGTLWQQGGATSWAWITYDPATNLLFYGTANPGVWNPDMRPGDNKWSSTIFARNPDTGKAVWAYQLVPHDGWDYDAVNESIVADLTINGTVRQTIVHFNKNGFAYVLNRKTGKLISATPFTNVTWATDVDLKTGAPTLNPAMSPHLGVVTNGICPSPLGGKDWEPAAFSPATKLFYIPAIDLCDNFEPLEAEFIAGTPFTGADVAFAPDTTPNTGELVAWDPVKKQRAWSVPEPLPVYAGVLATAGNIVFYGTLDKHFKAVDATTGAVLFDTVLECGIVSNPMTYSGPDGKQRVAVMTGVGWLAGGFAGGNCPAGGGFTNNAAPLAAAMDKLTWLPKPAAPVLAKAPTSGYVHVFKLP